MGAKGATGAPSAVRGIRFAETTEDERFMRFFSIVQNAASQLNAVFFMDCGDGHDLITDEIDCEDLVGWLVPLDAADDFEPLWAARDWDAMSDEQVDLMVTAEWSGESGDISVRFVPLP